MASGTAFHGPRRKLVLAFDMGTTYSGISYNILDPGQVPEIKGVTKFPGHQHVSGSSKIPTIIYYGQLGTVRAVGAETEVEGIYEIAEAENWTKAEWFKLHLRSKFGEREHIMKDIPPLPPNKTVVEVFADFLKYLLECVSSYIQATHPNGVDLWKYVIGDIDFVFSHPNGWEGKEQAQVRKAAVLAGLIPDSENSHARLYFVTEGEASLHFSIRNEGEGVTIVDAGGGTIEVSSTSQNIQASKYIFEEIAMPQCHFHGSVFVTIHSRIFLEKFLAKSVFLDDIDHIVRIFDNTTKPRFKQANEPQYINFGSTRDNDQAHNIRFGQLKLDGSDVASFFQPSVDCVLQAILYQRNTSKKPIFHAVLVGGFAASAWLFAHDAQVTESKEFRRGPYSLFYESNSMQPFMADIWCYRGNISNPRWHDEDTKNYTKLCSIELNLSHLLVSLVNSVTWKTYYQVQFSYVLLFGLTELKAQIVWMENGVEKRSPAKIIYDPDTWTYD